MTTLAYDGRLVAIDSQATADDLRYTEDKTYSVTDLDGRELVVFGAGTVSAIQAAVAALQDAPEVLPGGSYQLLVVGLRDAPVAFWGEDGLPVELRGHFVAGSGSQAALAALKDGRSATEAVLLACQVDLYSGPPVKTYDTVTRRWLKPRK